MKDAIKTRKSNRTFLKEDLTEKDITAINSYINNIENYKSIYNSPIRLELVKNTNNKEGKIGTYGVIKNAPYFVALITTNDKKNLIDSGYVFEKLILFIESLGLGTCWIGGTFDRSNFPLKNQPTDKEFIPVCTPVGKIAGKRAPIDRFFVATAKSNTREDFDKLFFKDNFNNSIEDKQAREILEFVRLAPSAQNRQPWRVVIKNNQTHFFLKRALIPMEKIGYDIQILDIGIAASHYVIASGKNDFIEKNPNIETPSKMEYIFSIG